MKSSQLSTTSKPKQFVLYSETKFVLTFNIVGIDSKFSEELEKLLNIDIKYDGYISLNTWACRIYQVVYETTDFYGFDIEYKNEIIKIIDESITKLAIKNGGLSYILFNESEVEDSA
jgi:hypothetical protein